MSANLFTAAAERLAIASGLPVSQARMRVLGTDSVDPFGPLFAIECDWCPEARASSAKHDAAYSCECGRMYRHDTEREDAGAADENAPESA